jgi:hypothetical protein
MIINPQPKDTSKGHLLVSLVKSIVRIIAGIALYNGALGIAGALIVVAEVLGILEELV